MTFAAVVVAAGRGVRFGGPKQLVDVAGVPLVAWSFAAFGSMPELHDMIVATEPDNIGRMQELATTHASRLNVVVVRGGATRQESVRRALDAVPPHCDAAFVHDGARPLVHPDDVRAGMAHVAPGRGALLAIPVVDTVKVVPSGGRRVTRTLDRAELWAAQTPQFGTLADLRAAHEAALRDGVEATDDAMLLERLGVVVTVVPTMGENFKVTLPSDRELAAAILRERRSLAAEPRA